MPSLRKIANSRFWLAVYRDANGKQFNRSTKIAFAGVGASPRERGQDAAKKLRLARDVANAYEQVARGHPTEQQVQRVLLDIFTRVNERRLEPALAENFFHAWLNRVRTRRGEGGTTARYTGVANRFLDSLGARRKAPLTDITSCDLQAFVDAQAKAGKAATTVRIEQKILNAAFADGLRQGLIASNPAAAVSVPVAAGETRRPFEWAQVRALLAAAEDEWKTVLMLGAFTGARLGDCATMRWECVDFGARVIRFRPMKTRTKGNELVVPMHPELEAHLLTVRMPDGEGAAQKPICPRLAMTPVGGRSGLSRMFHRLMEVAGIDNRQIRTGEGQGRSLWAYSFHSLRHTFNTMLLNLGVAEDLRMRLSGHMSEDMNRRYSHAEIGTLRSAIIRLPGVAP
jgi:integrase